MNKILPLSEMAEALGEFTVESMARELDRLKPNRRPMTYLRKRVSCWLAQNRDRFIRTVRDGKTHFRLKTGQIQLVERSPWDRFPPTPAPPIDLTDFNQQPKHWRDRVPKA